MERIEGIAKLFGIKPSSVKTIAKTVVVIRLIASVLFAVLFVSVTAGIVSRFFTIFASAKEPFQSQTYSESTSVSCLIDEGEEDYYTVNCDAN